MSFKKIIMAVALFNVLFTANVFSQSAGITSRYWDACKPSCAWNENSGGNPCIDCDQKGNTLNRGSNNQNACIGGSAYTCFYHAPFTIGDVGYGFAASFVGGCGECFELTFADRANRYGVRTRPALIGKKMIVMISNIGGIERNQFDIMIPGGGAGDFANTFGPQLQANGISNPDMGDTWGGFFAACKYQTNSCTKDMCDKNFGTAALEPLKQGCYWFTEWFAHGDNPDVDYKKVDCPDVLKDRYTGAVRTYGGESKPTNVRLSAKADPEDGGTVSVSPSSITGEPIGTYLSGTKITVTAAEKSGYTFYSWSGQPAGATISGKSISFDITANTNITARFIQEGAQITPGDTIKVEAESYNDNDKSTDDCDSYHPQGQYLVKQDVPGASGGKSVGYTCNGNKVTYNVNANTAGTYSMTLTFASANTDGSSGSIDVFVNDQKVGSVSGKTSSWTDFKAHLVSTSVPLNAGNNKIRLEIKAPVDIDYFMLIGEEKIVSVKHGNARPSRAASRMRATVTPISGGFAAMLPAGHGYTSYKVIDLQGREIRKGKIAAGTTDLKFGKINSGVVFLRLEGAGVKPQTLRATTVR